MKYIFAFFLLVFLTLVTWLGYVYSNIRFDIEKIVDYKPELTTQFYDKNNKHVANIFNKENRVYVKYEDIPARVIESLVAIEDTQFFEHFGINTEAISRAIIKDIKHRKLVEGASTLTQQLVKTMVLTRDKKIMRKVKEILLSIRLETILTKEEILERYLNEVYFGHGYYGIKTASLGYFKKELSQLNLKEIAILVGLPRAPSFYDPTRNLKFALARGNQVIARLKKLGWINEKEYEEYINYTPKVYKQSLTQNKAPYVVDFAVKELSKNLKDLKSGGYKVKLTIDLDAQNIAKDALQTGYENILKRDKWTEENRTKSINGAMITIENHTGKILTMVGGLDYKKSNFNRVTQSKRQPGSAVKPFLYQVALNLGYSPATELTDISRTYAYKQGKEEKKWQPKNYEGNFKGLIKLREALVHSRNLATINLVTDIGIDVVYKRLVDFGIEDAPYDLSITLGSFAISPLGLSKAYSIFSNNGIQVTPYMIDSITSRDNQEIKFEPKEEYLVPEEQSYLMTSILRDVVNRGTGRSVRIRGLDIAGKTGTTNKNVDAWFCGYTPTHQTIIWFGNDDNKPMNKSETGGRSAGVVFKKFHKEYMKRHPELITKFPKPEEVKESFINGQKEYYTETSPLPEVDNINDIKKDSKLGEIVF